MSRQLGPGTHTVVAHTTDVTPVGAAFVEPGENLSTLIEHFCLFPGYAPPSFDANGNSQNPLIVKACRLSDLLAGATGTGTNGAVTLADFFAVMRELQTASGHVFTYIRSTCVSSNGVPGSP
jgi:hypothetical protein